jgi:signal transduction histidine kinase
MNRKTISLIILLVGVPIIALFSIFTTYAFQLAIIPTIPEMFLWTILSFTSTFLYIQSPIKEGGGTSLGDIVDMAAIMTVGPYPVLLANCLVVLARRMIGDTTRTIKDIYNISQWTIACLTAYYIFQIVTLGAPLSFDWRIVVGGMLAWLGYSTMSTGLVAAAISSSEQMPFYYTWKANSARAMVVAMVLSPLAIIMAILYSDYNVLPVIFLTGTIILINTLIGYWIQRVKIIALYEREHQLAEMGKAASAILHEIARPLNRIVMLSDFALKGGRPKDEALQQVLEEAHTASRLSDKLLTSMRMNVARTEVYPDSLLEELKRLADTEGIPLLVADDGSEPGEATFWDFDLVCTALLNLARNAWESQNGEGDPPRITLSRNDSAGTSRPGIQGGEPVFCYSVTDSGPGISPGMEKDIFEALYSTKRKGLGMGLFIAHQVALAHGGSLRARNCEQGGAEFVLELPIRRK